MSDMEVFYGELRKSDLDIEPEDTDEFYELEEKYNKHFVKVGDQLWEFYPLADVDKYGFSIIVEPSDEKRIICYWYNGGAGLHEVVKALIEEERL